MTAAVPEPAFGEPARSIGEPAEGRRIEIRGTVQGVGFRPWVYRLAHEEGVAGRVSNDAGGVSIDAFGSAVVLDAFCDRLGGAPPPAAAIRELTWEPIPAAGDERGFVIVASRGADERRLSIPPDLATCDDCRRELEDPADRRHGYPFINCTHCGPRFTIALDVPYDRPATTMEPFALCADCRREYEDPLDRRFHAQPNACPRCGPRLRLLGAGGEELDEADPLAAAAAALAAGLVVAVKGVGGFHLACDASSSAAVGRLRERKRRQQKPFAVMVRDLEAARRVAVLDAAEERLLASVERPIVLARRRPGAGIADEAAPGLGLVGLLLPYSPLHHLLLAAAGRPLVMTSGNLSEEPIARRDREALDRLRGIADLFLVHDREIASRADDSVALVVAGAPLLMRRSRGWVPRPIPLARPLTRPILACGAQLKNTFCLGVGDAAYLGPHVGDLENLETYEAFRQAVEHLQQLLDVEPEVVAHDLHPEYLSTVYARRHPAAAKVAVQHHHAHVASAMAERGLDGPVLGVAFDGTGLGTDGTGWGGEILWVEAGDFTRLATLRPLPLAGGDTAVREVWRLALAAIDDAYDGAPPIEALGLFREVPADHLRLVRRMIERGVHTPRAHGAGRWFDAVGALLLDLATSDYEGQVAIRLNLCADAAETGRLDWALHTAGPHWEIDLRPAVRELVDGRLAGVPVARLAALFHNTLAAATAETVRSLGVGRDQRPEAELPRAGLPVVLTGGCFQNPLLVERLLGELRGFEVHLHREVPAGDGGIALGQLLVADATVRRSGSCV